MVMLSVSQATVLVASANEAFIREMWGFTVIDLLVLLSVLVAWLSLILIFELTPPEHSAQEVLGFTQNF